MRRTCSLGLGLIALALASASAYGGPCENEIYDADIALNKRLDSAAQQGQSTSQSVGAQLHRQPTPGSIAAAEGKAGDLSEADVRTVTEDMEAARKADSAEDLAGCEKALADVRRILGVLGK
jgi:hypothetical protein